MSKDKSVEKIAFYEKDKTKADLKIKLHSDGFSQAVFFRGVIKAYVDDDQAFMNWLSQFRVENSKIRSSATHTKTEKLENSGQQNLRKFGITTEEVDSIFDLIEKEYPEL